MNSQHRHSSGPPPIVEPATILLVIVFALATAVDLGIHAAAAIAGWKQPTWNPLVVGLRLITGKTKAPPLFIPFAVAALVLVAVVVFVIWRASRGLAGRPDHPDRAARLMANNNHLKPLTAKGLKEKSKRLGVQAGPGLPIGRAVVNGQVLYADWEAVQGVIAGPRRMKTAAISIPCMIAAPGPAFCTSNKPDLYAATRLLREEKGKVWTMDPQDLVGAEPDWWWNPLSYVTNDRRARELAEAFVNAYRDPTARTDGFFAPKGQKLVANLLLAAAKDGRPLTDCYRWVNRPDDDTPAVILKDHGLELAADAVLTEVHSAPDQRSGVYGEAENALGFLQDPEIARWVCRTGPGDSRPQLDLEAFVRSSDTLYLLSKEGPGSSAGVITALTMALCDAAETYAKRCPGGRLPVPMVGVLDEAANICRWAQLPSLYTHYGSRGIPLITILQGWSQGVEVWGEAGMTKLWSAANCKTFGGGVDEEGFLRALEQLIGEYNRITTSPSVSNGNGFGQSNSSTSWQATPTAILSVADLRALPRDRAVAFPAGSPPVLIRPLYWFEDKALKQRIEASIAKYDPDAAFRARQDRATAPIRTGDNPWVTNR